MNVFFDASVIIAALLSPFGGSAKLLELIRLGEIHGVTSQTVIEEVEDHARKINTSKEQIAQYIKQSNLLVRNKVTAAEIASYENYIDRDDAHLIAGSISTNCGYLVTLDKKHLLREEVKQHFKPLNILSPKEVLTEYLKT